MAWARTELRAQATSAPTPRQISPGHMRPAACFSTVRALLCRVLQTCEPCCKRVSCDRAVRTLRRWHALPKQRGGEKRERSRAGGDHGVNRFRAPERPSGPHGARCPQLEPKGTPAGLAPHRGGPGGRPPGGDCEPMRRRPERAPKIRATPGGYGGKPPGVAIIGVPTGARNAGRCSDGGPEHRFERYYGSPLDAYNPEHLFQVYVLLCVVYVLVCVVAERNRNARCVRTVTARPGPLLDFHSWPGPGTSPSPG